MGKFPKEKFLVSKIALYLLIMIVLTERYHTLAEIHTGKQESHKRLKRIFGEFYLKNYQVAEAQRGTTVSAETLDKWGKKRAGPVNFSTGDILIRPDGYGGGLNRDDKSVKNW